MCVIFYTLHTSTERFFLRRSCFLLASLFAFSKEFCFTFKVNMTFWKKKTVDEDVLDPRKLNDIGCLWWVLSYDQKPFVTCSYTLPRWRLRLTSREVGSWRSSYFLSNISSSLRAVGFQESSCLSLHIILWKRSALLLNQRAPGRDDVPFDLVVLGFKGFQPTNQQPH